MRQVCSWASYSWDQFFIRQRDSITLENLLFCAVSFSHRENRNSSVMAPAYCKASSYQWQGGGWSQCTTTWLHLHDHLRCKITGLAPRDGLNASFPLFLLCRPLRCLMFAADSIITAVWEGIKRYVACSVSHLLNIQLHCTGYDDSTGLDWLTGHWNQSQSAWISSFLCILPHANKKAILEWTAMH